MKIVAIGEVLWDVFPDGRETLGGTTANYTLHARGLGADAQLISRVGPDARGDEVLRIFTARGVPTELLQRDDDAPTGTVIVKLAEDGQPTYRIVENSAWDRLEATENARAAVAAAHAICFGTLGQRSPISKDSIRALITHARTDCLRVFDVNLRAPFWDESVIRESLSLCNVLKINEDELQVVLRMLGLPSLEAIAARYDLRLVALTRGAHGSILLSRGERSEQRGISTTVRDTIGAGDSFAATLTVGLLEGWALDVINERANCVAAYVCSQDGATPRLPRLW